MVENALYYLGLGFLVVLAIIGIAVLSYLLLIAALVGIGLYAARYLYKRFALPQTPPAKTEGRVFNHDEFK